MRAALAGQVIILIFLFISTNGLDTCRIDRGIAA
jgi:hypothetical protein